ncbi:MAG: Fic family protein [bacterium]
MKSFEHGCIEKIPISHNLLSAARALGEYKGREGLFKRQSPQVLKTLLEIALIQSAESSNRIEGVTAPHKRIVELLTKKTSPRNRSEQEITGYRNVLNTIHSNHQHIPFNTNVVLQFHRDLYAFSEGEGGRWKSADNEITETRANGEKMVRFKPASAAVTPQYMVQLHESFTRMWNADETEKLILIPVYVLDFLCIHPFRDGNGRMSRLLTLLLLYHAGYEVGRFISLEKIIEDSKETYYEALLLSSKEWHRGKHDLLPWVEYFLGTLIAAYKEFERRAGTVDTTKGAKTGTVLNAVQSFMGDFAVSDIQEACPAVGIDLIRRVLRQQRNAGAVECLGRGPDSRWRRI